MAGFSNSASAGPIGCTSGREAFEFGAFELGALDFGALVDFFEESGVFIMPGIWDAGGGEKRAIVRLARPC
jgi:hypothetical protein